MTIKVFHNLKLSSMDLKSVSDNTTTFPDLPVTIMGSLVVIASSINLKKLFLAVVAFIILNLILHLPCTQYRKPTEDY